MVEVMEEDDAQAAHLDAVVHDDAAINA